MNAWVESMAYWLADFYLAATVLLVAALAAVGACSQPAKRLAVAKAAIVAAALLGVLCALPGWSVVSLGGVDATEAAAVTPVAVLPAVTPTNELPRFEEAAPIAPAASLSRPARAVVAWNWNVPWLTLLVTGFFVGCAAVASWLVMGIFAAVRLVQRADRFPDTLLDVQRDVAGVGELLVSQEVDMPVALGVFRPRVILPREWIETRTAAELSTVLAHEAAHIRNGDLRWLAASRLLLVVLWAQPLYWWLRRQMRLDQETLADAAAAEVAGRQAYAEQLVAWARDVVTRPRPLLPASVGLWEGASQLRRRVAVLLDDRFAVFDHCPREWRWAVMTFVLLGAVVVSLVTLEPGQATEPAVAKQKVEASEAHEISPVVLTDSQSAGENPSSIEQQLGFRSLAPEKAISNAILGRCVDEEGRALAGVEVTASLWERQVHTYQLLQSTETNGQGEFRFEKVIPASVSIEPGGQDPTPPIVVCVARKAGWASRSVGHELGTLRGTGQAIEFVMPVAATLRGRVVDADGEPVAGADVKKLTSMGQAEGLWSDRTDDNGEFAINDLAPFSLEQEKRLQVDQRRRAAQAKGDFATFSLAPRFEVVHDDFGTVRLPLTDIPASIEVTLEPGSTIAGRVVLDDGTPAGDVVVRAATSVPRRRDFPEVLDWAAVDQESMHDATTKTDANGRFQFRSLKTAKYDVWAEAAGLKCGGVSEVAAVSGIGTIVPDLVLSRGREVRIQLVDEAGKPVASADVIRGEVLLAPLAKPGRQEAWPQRIEFGRNGGAIVRALPAKSHINLSRLSRGDQAPDDSYFVQQTIDVGNDGMTMVEFPVPNQFVGEPANESKAKDDGKWQGAGGAEVKVETRHLSLGGGGVNSFVAGYPATPWDYEPNVVRLEIDDADGKPIERVGVDVYRDRRATGERELVRQLITNDEGVAEVKGLLAPEKVTEFREKLKNGQWPGPTQDVFYFVITHEGAATIILPASDFTIASSGLKRRVRMRPAAELAGQVRDKDGKPVAGATVTAGAMAGLLVLEGANAVTTDSDGRYRFTNLVAFDREAGRARLQEQMKWATAANSAQDKMHPAIYDPAEAMTTNRLVVTHPDFAVTGVEGGDIPGEMDVVMLPAAAIEGRVIDHGTGKPAADVRVQASGRIETDASGGLYQPVGSSTPLYDMNSHTASTQTDGEGRYRLANLPAGTYEVWAQHPSSDWRDIDWVSTVDRNLNASPGPNALQAADLVVGPGGTIHGRLVDATTGKRIVLDDKNARVRAMFHFIDGMNQQQGLMQDVPMADDGSFKLRTFPSKARVFVDVRKGLQLTGSEESEYRSPDDFYRMGPVFDLAHGESVDAKLPVMSAMQLDEVRNAIQMGFEALPTRHKDKAIQLFTAALQISPNESSALAGRAQAYEGSGKFGGAIADYEKLAGLEPEAPMWPNNLAELLATSPNESERDGTRAVELARRALALAKQADAPESVQAEMLDTLAAAQAEAGDFSAAVATEREAIEKTPKGMAAEMQQRLEAFEAGRAWRREVIGD